MINGYQPGSTTVGNYHSLHTDDGWKELGGPTYTPFKGMRPPSPLAKTRVYIIGALKNPAVPETANILESAGHEVFADWFSPGPEADSYWHDYETRRGRTYRQAIDGPHAWNAFSFDKKWLDWCDVAVLVLPAGKSGHLELGYCIGSGKRGFILMDGEPERWDLMYRFAEKVVYSTGELIDALCG